MQKNKVNLLIIVIVIIILVFSIWTWFQRPIEVKTMEVEFSVGSSAGVNIDTDKLYLGRVTPGSSSSRAVNIENSYDFPVKIKVFVTKSIADYIFLNEEFTIDSNNVTRVPIDLSVPQDIPYGNYTGELRFEFRKL